MFVDKEKDQKEKQNVNADVNVNTNHKASNVVEEQIHNNNNHDASINKDTANCCCHKSDLKDSKTNTKNKTDKNLDQKNICKGEQSTQITKLKAQIKELQQQNKKQTDIENELLKNKAELINFKKRMQQQKIQEFKYASSVFISNLLMPLEQLEKVLEFSTDNELLKKYLLGFQMIQQQIKTILKEEGVKEIQALGQVFDPKVHHALETVSDPQKPNKTIISVLQKGYFYKDKILRPAMVQINEWSNKNGENK
ncbi:nucleotide exchange factor GrpE ['Fragaria x ananassa' phyllody phytoplasma]|uniref:Protein GrpE n=1 Tax='Fragaria x ananassa' phyllody phytoplasma TaxID=2358428 RepID=A0ABS5K3S5_9MOLU|nr:nucleotide exchange factor GrpE ['Fragaria x ananassa' phyllody phytoplasma]MBS2126434.1 nucleotide exchange factor GrpE ['Fragaria x ananassa' phyllody phytoplasma]